MRVLLYIDVATNIDVYKEMVKVNARLATSVVMLFVCLRCLFVCCSVDSLCVTDSTGEDKFKKIVSLAEDTDKASSLMVKIGGNPSED